VICRALFSRGSHPAAILGAEAENPRAGGVEGRHQIRSSNVSSWLKESLKKAGIEKKVTAHTFRHSYTAPVKIQMGRTNRKKNATHDDSVDPD